MSGKNLYFGALAFIYAVKSGPFWEHSSTLFNISGLDGWAKINKVSYLKASHSSLLTKASRAWLRCSTQRSCQSFR